MQSASSLAYLVMNFSGGLLGLLSFAPMAARLGRRGAFAIYHVGAGILVPWTYLGGHGYVATLFLLSLMAFFVLGMHAGYAIYFPELFPTRLRATGSSVCFNLGRVLGAVILIVRGGLGFLLGMPWAATAISGSSGSAWSSSGSRPRPAGASCRNDDSPPVEKERTGGIQVERPIGIEWTLTDSRRIGQCQIRDASPVRGRAMSSTGKHRSVSIIVAVLAVVDGIIRPAGTASGHGRRDRPTRQRSETLAIGPGESIENALGDVKAGETYRLLVSLVGHSGRSGRPSPRRAGGRTDRSSPARISTRATRTSISPIGPRATARRRSAWPGRRAPGRSRSPCGVEWARMTVDGFRPHGDRGRAQRLLAAGERAASWVATSTARPTTSITSTTSRRGSRASTGSGSR